MANRHRFFRKVAKFLAMSSCLALLHACIDPTIDIKDVSSEYIDLGDDAIRYETQVEFTLLKGKGFISGATIVPTKNLEEQKKGALKLAIWMSAETYFESSLPKHSVFVPIRVLRLSEGWPPLDNSEDSYCVTIRLDSGEECGINETAYALSGNSIQFNPEFIRKADAK